MGGNPQSEIPATRRRYPRYEIETELRATILGVKRRVMRGRSLNINEGGIAGVFATGWDAGTSVNLQFSVPIATTPVRVRGVVRNRAGYRYGFEFVELTPQQQETISRTCRMLGLLQ
jgi:c-di-GMP-binding flagellar brake protein YcgR